MAINSQRSLHEVQLSVSARLGYEEAQERSLTGHSPGPGSAPLEMVRTKVKNVDLERVTRGLQRAYQAICHKRALRQRV